MPYLKKNDDHVCPLCPYSTIRKHMKHHLTTAGKKGPRCPMLKKVIPSDIWENQILQYYKNDAPPPDLSYFKSTPLKRKRKITTQAKKKEKISQHRCPYSNVLTNEMCTFQSKCKKDVHNHARYCILREELL